MNKNIALFTYTLLSGGAEKQLVILANTYSKIHKVTVFIYFSDLIDQRILNLLDENNNLSIVKLRGSIFNKIKSLKKEIKQRKINYFFSYLTFPNLLGSIIAKTLGVSLIFSSVRSAHLPMQKWFVECIVNRYIADYTIFNNYKGEMNSRRFGLKGEKNIVISNCLESPIAVFSNTINKPFLTIITVGRFVKEKDYQTSLLAIKLLHEKGYKFKYIIVGYGKLEFEIRKLIQKLAIEDVVEIVIRPNDVYPYLLESDIYLSTSLFEGTSNSILEAMNSNLPIVATNVGDNNYLIEEGLNGFLLEKRDVNGIAKKLESLLIDKTLIERLGVNNSDVIKRKFSQKVFEKNYLELLNIEKSK